LTRSPLFYVMANAFTVHRAGDSNAIDNDRPRTPSPSELDPPLLDARPLSPDRMPALRSARSASLQFFRKPIPVRPRIMARRSSSLASRWVWTCSGVAATVVRPACSANFRDVALDAKFFAGGVNPNAAISQRRWLIDDGDAWASRGLLLRSFFSPTR
jgi:hypothetical protein